MPKNTLQHDPKTITRVKKAALSLHSSSHHKQRYHTAETTSSGKKVEMQSLAKAEDDKSLEGELQSCLHFLGDSEIQKGRHGVFNFVVNNLTAQVIGKQLDRVLDRLKCASKLNLALGFNLKIIEDGKFRYFYAHENNTLLEQSILKSNKDDKAKLKKILKKTDVIESCAKEKSRTKRGFSKLTNLAKFAALLRDIPMGCKVAALPESRFKNHTVNCLTYEQNNKKNIQRQSSPLQSTCSPLACK